MDRKIPAIVIKTLVHVYKEQKAFVKLLENRSEIFGIKNCTKQGSVLSPSLISVFIDGLLQQLRQLGLGCHVGGVWYGATCFADDLFLLAPSRTAIQMMLETC